MTTPTPFECNDAYTCPTCGQTVFTTMGEHICPRYRVRSVPIVTTATNYVPLTPLPAIRRRPRPKVRT